MSQQNLDYKFYCNLWELLLYKKISNRKELWKNDGDLRSEESFFLEICLETVQKDFEETKSKIFPISKFSQLKFFFSPQTRTNPIPKNHNNWVQWTICNTKIFLSNELENLRKFIFFRKNLDAKNFADGWIFFVS